MMLRRLFLITAICLSGIHLSAQNFDLYQKKEFIKNQDTLKYRILYPENMTKGVKYPLVLFLHGAGERGSDNEKQLTHGGSLFLNNKNREKFPAVVVFPQCPRTTMWTAREKEKDKAKGWVFHFPVNKKPTKPAKLTNELLEELMHTGMIDTSRIYIMGLSMGGIGTLEFLYRWHNKFAAAVVMCGGNDPALASTYCDVPVWFFHGGKDNVVPPRYSRTVYDVLKKCNRKTKYTLFPKDNHNCWDSAFAQPRLLKWLFNKKK